MAHRRSCRRCHRSTTVRWERAIQQPVKYIIGLLVAVGLVAGVALLVTRDDGDRVPDEQVAVDGDQGPQLVGRDRCAECHSEIAELHDLSGHSSTFSLTRDWDRKDEVCGVRKDCSFADGEYEYLCDELGLAVGQQEQFGERLFPLDYAVGSGHHAVTFLTLLQEPNGETVGIESHHTWFEADGELHVTPGQSDLEPLRDVEMFGRIFRGKLLEDCINCHTTSAVINGREIHDLVAGVQCERCHGPGSEHVAAADQGDDETAFGLMHRDWTAMDEVTMCGECHRMPAEIDAERLSRYPNSLVRFQPIGLLQSRCFTESSGELRCSTCHNPHAPASATSSEQQVQNCLNCHGESADQTHCPVSPVDDCIRCHMPAIKILREISFHDHWIRIRSDEPQPDQPEEADVPISSSTGRDQTD